MRRQDVIRVKPCTAHLFIDELTVGRRTRPVHELVRLVGAFVKIIHAKPLRKIPRHRHIFFWGHVPCQREHKAYPRFFRRMAVGAVKHGGIRHGLFITRQELRVDAVAVQRHHGTGLHRVDLPPAAL